MAPCDIYSQQLFPIGFGHPLWFPEPNPHEVFIGDVGWLSEKGGFRRLFNSRYPEDHDLNREKRVPPGFALLRSDNLSINGCDEILQRIVVSRSMRNLEFQADVSAGAG